MIDINIRVRNGEVLDHVNDKNTNLSEVGCAIIRLEQIKLRLIEKDFESKFGVEQDA